MPQKIRPTATGSDGKWLTPKNITEAKPYNSVKTRSPPRRSATKPPTGLHKLPLKTQRAVRVPAVTAATPYWSWKKIPRKLANPTNPPNVTL